MVIFAARDPQLCPQNCVVYFSHATLNVRNRPRAPRRMQFSSMCPGHVVHPYQIILLSINLFN